MNIKRATALALSLSLLLGAAACGKSDSEAADTGSKTSAELLEEENAILDAHQELWNQVFASMDKSSPATAENYGDVLLSALVIVCIIKAMNTAKDKRLKKQEEEAPAPTTKKCPFCLSDIPLAATRCPHCTSEQPTEEKKPE